EAPGAGPVAFELRAERGGVRAAGTAGYAGRRARPGPGGRPVHLRGGDHARGDARVLVFGAVHGRDGEGVEGRRRFGQEGLEDPAATCGVALLHGDRRHADVDGSLRLHDNDGSHGEGGVRDRRERSEVGDDLQSVQWLPRAFRGTASRGRRRSIPQAAERREVDGVHHRGDVGRRRRPLPRAIVGSAAGFRVVLDNKSNISLFIYGEVCDHLRPARSRGVGDGPVRRGSWIPLLRADHCTVP
ncbi:hypothetical protein THAOC_19236, partial [Thalassiosira oceanica]